MARKQIHKYTFTPATNTIVLDGIYNRDRILLINNATDNEEMFAFSSEFNSLASYAFDGPNETTTLVLNKDCSAMDAADVLQIWIDSDATEIQPTESYTDPVSKLRVSTPENLIDTDFEYGLQSTKWETLELVKNIPTFFSRNGDEDIEISDVTTQANSNIIVVETVDVHNLVQGNPIIVQGTTNNNANGAFVVTKILNDSTFQYTAKRTIQTTKSIKDTYTQVFLGSIYQGTEFKLSNVNGVTTDGANPSTLTVSTKYPMGFSADTSFFLTNSVGQKIITFDASLVTPTNVVNISRTIDVDAKHNDNPTGQWHIGAWNPMNWKPKDALFFEPDTAEINISTANETFTFPNPHGFDDGQYVVYLHGYGNAAIGGLTDTRPYWVRKVDDYTFYLTLSGPSSTNKVNITNNGASNQMMRHCFVKAYDPISSNTSTEYITFAGQVPYVENDRSQAVALTYTTVGGLPIFNNSDVLPSREPGDNLMMYTKNVTVGTNTTMRFSRYVNGATYNLNSGTVNGALIIMDVDPLRDTLRLADHGFQSNDVFRFSSNRTSPISNNNYYEVTKINDDYFRFRRYEQAGLWNLTNYGDRLAVVTITGRSYQDDADQIQIVNHGLSNGDAVVYTNEGNTSIGGLTNGVTYYVTQATNNTLKLATNTTGYSTPDITWRNYWPGSNRTIGYTDPSYQYVWKNGHGFSTGDRVEYTSNTPIGGLRNGGHYYIRRIDANRFYLNHTSAGALAGSAFPDRVWFSQVLTGTSRLRRVTSVDITSAGSGTQKFTANVDGASDGVYPLVSNTDATTFTMSTNAQIPSRDIQFDPASSVSIEEDAIRIPDHYFRTGYEVTFTTTGTAPGGLTHNTTYYVIRVSRNWIRLSETYDDAIDGETYIDLTSVGSGLAALSTPNIIGEVLGQGTLTIEAGSDTITGNNTNFSSFFKTGDQISVYEPETYTTRTVTSTNISADTMDTSGNHGYTTGDLVILEAVTLPTPLINGGFYYVRAIDANTVSFHPTRADAIANTGLINITAQGGGITLKRLNSIGATHVESVKSVLSPTKIKLVGAIDNALVGAEYAVGTGLLLRSDGFALHRPFDGGVELIPSTNPDSQMVRQTRKYFRYQSGKGIQVSFAVNFSPTTQIERIESDGTTGVTTAYTRYPHRLSTGLNITISGAPLITEGGVDTDFYNGVQEITAIPDEYSFQFTLTSFPSAEQSTGGFADYYVNAWTNSALRCGLFDDQNGMFFEYDGSELKVCRRSSTLQISGTVTVSFGEGVVTGNNTKFQSQLAVGQMIVIKGQSYLITGLVSDTTLYIAPSYRGTSQSGVVVTKTIDTKVPQSEWNIDKADGTGPTGYYLNLNRIQMAYMDYSWYGAGKVRFGFKDQNGNVKYVHSFIHNNKFTEAYLRSGNLPARYDIQNVGQPTYVPALAHWGTSVIMDGTFDDDKAYIFNASSQSVQLTGTSVLTVSARSAYTSYYYALVDNRLRAVGYALESAANSTYNSLVSGQTISGANYNGSMRDPLDGRIQPRQPYQPSINASPGYSYNNLASRNLIVLNNAPSGTTGTNSNYTVTLSAVAEPVVYDIPLISIRLSPSVDTNTPGFLGEREIVNRMQLILKSVGILSTHACEITLRLNGQIDNSDWSRVVNPSLSQLIYHNNKDSIQSGTDIYSFRAEGGTGTSARTPVVTTEELGEVATLGNSILGGDNTYPDGPDVLTVVARLTEDPSKVTTSNPFTIIGRVSWSESQA